ncbi:MAG: serine/threonine-protein kinase [Acidobacteriaceae bacterium]
MVCPNCAGENDDAAVSCRKCGTALRVRAANRQQSSGGIAVGIAPSPVPWDELPGTAAESDAFPNLGSRYRVEKKLGEGGMGAVFKAWDNDLDRYVAVKLMRKELVSHPESLMRFKQELLLASKISHRNILRIYDLSDAGGTKFFTMAYIDGEDLAGVIAREGAMSVERATELALQICGALEAAHREGVVHRDLKPENILLDQQGQVYVSDFGLSTSVENVNATRLTISGQSIGTPRYMSPEQVQSKAIDQRSDLYAFGLILYEMLTGQAPFSGNSVFEQMFQRVQNTPKPPSEFRPGLPAYIQNVVLRCLEREPENRYQSAEEIVRDLKQQSAEPVKTPSGRNSSITIAMPRQPRTIGAIALAAVLAIGAAGGGVYWYEHHGQPGGTGAMILTRVAVLPFQVVGDDPQLKLMAEGFHDSLTGDLSQLHSVNVASGGPAIKPGEPVEQVAKQLGVQYVVTATLQGTSNRVRLGVKVEDASGKTQPWTYSLDGVPQDILTLQDQLMTQVTAALKVNASGDELARSATHGTADIQAYDLYLKGKDALRGDTLRDIQSAVAFFESAVKADPKFALGYAGLGSASLSMYLRTKDTTWAQRASGAAQQARSLDPNLPEAHFAAAHVYANTGRSAEAIAELQSALKLAPNSDEGYRRLAEAYASASKKDEAIEAAKKSIDLNPYYWVNYNALGQLYLRFGDYPNALIQFKKVNELDPSNGVGYRNYGMTLFSEGKIADAVEPLKKSLDLDPTFEGYSNLATAYFYQKKFADSAEMYKKAIALNPREQLVAGNLGDVYRAMGQQTQADQMYKKAIELAGEDLKVNPKRADTLSAMALYYAKMGDSIRALPLIDRARKIDPNDATLLSDQAIVYALIGRVDDAFPALDAAFAHGYAVEDAETEPELAKLRTDPRYQQLTAKYKK